MHQVRQRITSVLWLLIASISWSFANAQTVQTPVTVSYAMRFKTPAEVEKVFTPLVANSPNVQLSTDPQHGRLTVTGPAWAHDLFKQVAERIDVQTPGNIGQSSQSVSLQAARETAATQPPAPQGAKSQPTRLPSTPPLGQPHSQADSSKNLQLTRRLMPLPMGQSKAIRDEVLRLFGHRLSVADTPEGERSS